MRDKMIKKLGKRGLVVIGVLFLLTIACLFALSPKVAMAAITMGSLGAIGMATATPVDELDDWETVRYAHTVATVPGDVIVYNGAVLVAINTADANADNIYIFQSDVLFPKEANLAINQFDKVYWDAVNSVITKTSAGNTACGFCTYKALAADTTVQVELLPSVATPDIVQSTQNTITDPGNAGAIPVTKSGVCAITTAGAETRTLAIPGHIGQIIMLMIDIDGGSCVVTSAQAINQTGNNTITINDVNDTITLIGGSIGGALRWRVLANDGAVLSTV